MSIASMTGFARSLGEFEFEKGNVSWTFKVSSNVKPGTYEVKISDEKDSASYSLEVSD